MQGLKKQISRKWLVLVVLLALIPIGGAALYAYYPSPRSIMEEMWTLRTSLLASLRDEEHAEALAIVGKWQELIEKLPTSTAIHRRQLSAEDREHVAALEKSLANLRAALEQPGEEDVQDLAVDCFEAHRQCEGLFREAPASGQAGGHREGGGAHAGHHHDGDHHHGDHHAGHHHHGHGGHAGHDHGGHGGHQHGMLEIAEGEPVPTIEISVIKDPMKGWSLRTETTNFEFAPELASTPHKPGVGHGHLYVNGKKVTRLYSEWYFLGDLPPGKNVIRVTLNSNDHNDLAVDGKVIEDQATVEIEDNRKLVYFGGADAESPAAGESN
jgi:hypothetical protein